MNGAAARIARHTGQRLGAAKDSRSLLAKAGRAEGTLLDVQSQSRRPRQLDAWAERGAEVKRVEQGEQLVDVDEGRGRLVAKNAAHLCLGIALRVRRSVQPCDGLGGGVLVRQRQRHGLHDAQSQGLRWQGTDAVVVRGPAEGLRLRRGLWLWAARHCRACRWAPIALAARDNAQGAASAVYMEFLLATARFLPLQSHGPRSCETPAHLLAARFST